MKQNENVGGRNAASYCKLEIFPMASEVAVRKEDNEEISETETFKKSSHNFLKR